MAKYEVIIKRNVTGSWQWSVWLGDLRSIASGTTWTKWGAKREAKAAANFDKQRDNPIRYTIEV